MSWYVGVIVCPLAKVLSMQYQTHQRKRMHWVAPTKRKDALHGSVGGNASQKPIRVLIADQHEVVRVGVREILKGEEDLTVVGEVDNTDGLFSAVQRTKPNIMLLGARLSGGLNADSYRRLLEAPRSVRVIMLVEAHDLSMWSYVVEHGVQGYLSKAVCHKELSRAIRLVAKGESYLAPEGSPQLLHFLRQQAIAVSSRSELGALSSQEYRIIALIAEGNTNKEIAVKLGLSDKTVKNYIANMFSKLAIERRTQAVALYLKAQQPYAPMGEGIHA